MVTPVDLIYLGITRLPIRFNPRTLDRVRSYLSDASQIVGMVKLIVLLACIVLMRYVVNEAKLEAAVVAGDDGLLASAFVNLSFRAKATPTQTPSKVWIG